MDSQQDLSLFYFFQNYKQYKKDNIQRYEQLKRIPKSEMHSHFSQIVIWINLLKKIQSLFADNLYFRFLKYGDQPFQSFQLYIDENNTLQPGGYIKMFSKNHKCYINIQQEQEMIYIKYTQEIFYDVMKQHLKRLNKQFLYYRVHSYIFKTLIYGSKEYSKGLNEILIKNYFTMIEAYCIEHSIQYMDIRISLDKMEAIQYYEPNKTKIKFIIQNERHNMHNFQINSILDAPYYKKIKNHIIGIDFTGLEDKEYDYRYLYQFFDVMKKNNLEFMFHVGEELTGEKKKICLKNLESVMNLYKDFYGKEFSDVIRIGHGYTGIESSYSFPQNLIMEFCVSTLTFQQQKEEIPFKLDRYVDKLCICTDDSSRYQMDISDCYLYLYYLVEKKQIELELVEQIIDNQQNILKKIIDRY